MSATSTPTTAISEARRRTLIDATIEVIASQGLAGASVSRIADQAGMSKPAVLYHVASRDALIEDTVAEVRDGYLAHVRRAVDRCPDARSGLFAYVEEALRYLWARPTHLRVLDIVRHAHPAPPGATDEAGQDTLRLIETGSAAGALAASDPALTAAALDGALAAILVHGLNGSDDDRENLIGEAVGLVDRVVTPR